MSSKISKRSIRVFNLILIFHYWLFKLYVFFKAVKNSLFIFIKMMFFSKCAFNVSCIWLNLTSHCEVFFFAMNIAIMTFKFMLFRFFKMNVFSLNANNFNREKTLKIIWSFFDLILILIDRIDKNWKTQISRKLNLSIFVIIRKIWLIISAIATWFVKMKTEKFLYNSIKCLIFRTIYTISTIFNSIDQYFISAIDNFLFKNIIDCMSNFLKFVFFESFLTWKIMMSKSFYLKTFTFINNYLFEIKWIKKLDLLKMFCKIK